MKYLETPIVEVIDRPPANPHSGLTSSGYTKRSGAPTSKMVRLQGGNKFRRLMVWQFSNCGTLFVRIKGECLIVRECDIPG